MDDKTQGSPFHSGEFPFPANMDRLPEDQQALLKLTATTAWPAVCNYRRGLVERLQAAFPEPGPLSAMRDDLVARWACEDIQKLEARCDLLDLDLDPVLRELWQGTTGPQLEQRGRVVPDAHGAPLSPHLLERQATPAQLKDLEKGTGWRRSKDLVRSGTPLTPEELEAELAVPVDMDEVRVRQSQWVMRYLSARYVHVASGHTGAPWLDLMATMRKSNEETEPWHTKCDLQDHLDMVYPEIYYRRKVVVKDAKGKPVKDADGKPQVEDVIDCESAGALFFGKGYLKSKRSYERDTFAAGELLGQGRVLNLWDFLSKQRAEPAEAATLADAVPLVAHLGMLAGGNTVAVNYTMHWLAWLYAKPEQRLRSAITCYSYHRQVGKGMLGELFSRLYGDALVRKCTVEELLDRENAGAANKVLTFANEAADGDSHFITKPGEERLKNLISEGTYQSKRLYANKRQRQNTSVFWINVNSIGAFSDNLLEERVLVMGTDAPRMPQIYYTVMLEWMRGCGASIMAGVFESWDFSTYVDESHGIRGFAPGIAVPVTDMARDMADSARGCVGQFLRSCLHDRNSIFHKATTATTEQICRSLRMSHATVLREFGAKFSEEVVRKQLGKMRDLGVVSNRQRVAGHSEAPWVWSWGTGTEWWKGISPSERADALAFRDQMLDIEENARLAATDRRRAEALGTAIADALDNPKREET